MHPDKSVTVVLPGVQQAAVVQPGPECTRPHKARSSSRHRETDSTHVAGTHSDDKRTSGHVQAP